MADKINITLPLFFSCFKALHLNRLFSSKFIFWLIVLSFLPLIAYFSGALTKRLNALDIQQEVVLSSVVVNDNVKNNYFVSGNYLISHCEVIKDDPNNLCGFAFDIGANSAEGLDLSGFDSVEIDIVATGPKLPRKIRFALKNFSPEYSSIDDPVSAKYNAVLIDPTTTKRKIKLPLSYFRVESWWISYFDLPAEQSLTDFNNITNIEILHLDATTKGEYTFSVEGITFIGSYVTINTILITVMLCWIVVIGLLIIRNHKDLISVVETDFLTKISNRNGMIRFLDSLEASESTPVKCGIIYIDLDNFKYVNDTFGHDEGDNLLTSFSEIIKNALHHSVFKPNTYRFTRLSGDEFVIIIANPSEVQLSKLATNILSDLKMPIQLAGKDYKIGASLGGAIAEIIDSKASKLFKNADIAMYVSKHSGKNQFTFYNETIEKLENNERQIVEHVKQSLRNNNSHLSMFPLFHTDDKTLDLVELRLPNQQAIFNEYSKKQIDEIAKKYDLDCPIDMFVVEKAMSLLSNWDFTKTPNLKFLLPISNSSIESAHFLENLLHILRGASFDLNRIILQFDEPKNEGAQNNIFKHLLRLAEENIQLSINNFGQFQGTISWLKSLNLSLITIHPNLLSNAKEKEVREFSDKHLINYLKLNNAKIRIYKANTMEDLYHFLNLEVDYMDGFLISTTLTKSKIISITKSTTKDLTHPPQSTMQKMEP
ncbi:diguanylate cyclase domain-containing protein [Glaciecola sp. 1036]|uniref:diguanylate cyclase domain-containing protein n=1 Tax=Alteromonadaceae TaxID=72275 RepID=UPI003CFD52D1